MKIIDGRVYIDNREKSPCMVSKVKYVLGLKSTPPENDKRSSKRYYIALVEAIGKYFNVSQEIIERAKKSNIYLR